MECGSLIYEQCRADPVSVAAVLLHDAHVSTRPGCVESVADANGCQSDALSHRTDAIRPQSHGVRVFTGGHRRSRATRIRADFNGESVEQLRVHFQFLTQQITAISAMSLNVITVDHTGEQLKPIEVARRSICVVDSVEELAVPIVTVSAYGTSLSRLLRFGRVVKGVGTKKESTTDLRTVFAQVDVSSLNTICSRDPVKDAIRLNEFLSRNKRVQ